LFLFRHLIILLIVVLSLHALSDTAILKRADFLIKSKSQSNQFRAYNDYKNLYLRAIMNDDEDLKKCSLTGIVRSGSKLHIDVSRYVSELKKTIYNVKVPKKKSLKKITHKTSYNKPKSKANKKTKKAKYIKVKSSHKLKSVKWKQGELILSFDKKLKNNQVNYFTLYDSNKKIYKYVFDIHASMITESKNIKKSGIKRIKLGQYNSSTIRLVIENNEKLNVRFSKKPRRLIVRINGTKKKTKVNKKYIPLRADRNKVIVIDAGHGGKDPGAIGYKKHREKVVVLSIALELNKLLRSRGYKVYMTRHTDKFIKLSRRTKYANKKNADIFVSIHANAVDKKIASKAQGVECYFLSPSRSSRAKKVAEKENSADLSDMNRYGKNSYLNLLNHRNILASNKLAIDLQRGMLGSLNKKYKKVIDGGVREGPFWVLVGAQMPSVLVEVGFMTHPKESTRLSTSKYKKTMARGLADGIERYFANN